MKHKTLRTLLCVILTVCFCMSAIVPASAAGLFGGDWSAASTWDQMMRNLKDWFGNTDTQPSEDMDTPVADTDTYDTTSGTNGEFMRIFHLDCGRKYFSVDEIKGIIDQLAANNYTHIELAFGNDGFRFLLENMEVEANNTTYSSDDVKTAIAYGNTKDHIANSTGTLSESEMDDIIDYAKKGGKNNGHPISVIPMIDVPGHTNTLIYAMQNLNIAGLTTKQTNSNSSSKPTYAFEVGDNDATRFVVALVEKYVDYFRGKGSTYFNIGADECGYSTTFVDNTALANYLLKPLVTYIKGESMTPMMFNDGFRYASTKDTTSALMNALQQQGIAVCYWEYQDKSKENPAYIYKTATELQNAGFTVINTHNKWYYVAGLDGNDGNKWYGYDWAIDNMTGSYSDCTKCDYEGTADTGCMLAFWCDDPSKSVNTTNLYNYIATLANNNPDYFKASATPATPTLTSTKTSLAVGETATLTVSNAGDANIEWSVTNDKVLKLNTTAANSTAANASVQVQAIAEGTSAVNAVVGTTTLSVDITVSATRGDTLTEKTITVTVGDTVTDMQDGVNVNEDGNIINENGTVIAEYSAEYTKVNGGTELKLGDEVTSTGDGYITAVDADGKRHYMTIDNKGNIGDTTVFSEATQFTVTYYSSGYNSTYEIKTKDTGRYLIVYSSWGNGNKTYSLGTRNNSSSETRGWLYYNNTGWSKDRYLVYNNGWTVAKNDPSNVYGKIYPITEETLPDKDGTEVSFTGKVAGTSTVTIGNVTYTVNVVPAELKNVTPLPIQLWVTNNTIEVDETTNTKTPNNSGWGGNTDSSGFTYGRANYVNVSAQRAYGEKGISLLDAIGLGAEPLGRYEWGGTRFISLKGTEEKVVQYLVLWTGRVHNSSDSNIQTAWGTDYSNSGDAFNYVRYYDGKWSVSEDRVNWKEYAITGAGSTGNKSSCTQQLAAYYMTRTKITNEVTTEVADWGKPKGGDEYNSQVNGDNFVLLDFAVRYEDNTISPDTFPVDTKTLAYHCNTTNANQAGEPIKTDSSGNYYRQLNNFRAINSDDFEVYMVTVTMTNDAAGTELSAAEAKNGYTYKGTEKIVWAIDDAALENSGFDPYISISDSENYNGCKIGGSPYVNGVEVYNKHGALITYYVRAKEGALTVHYHDRTRNDQEFYNYNIVVTAGTFFNPNFRQKEKNSLELEYNTVKNKYNVDQAVSADLVTMRGIPAQYRYSKYTCVEVKLVKPEGANGPTEVHLYYTFNADVSFVVDFGLPLTIPYTELNENLEGADVEITGITAGNAIYGSTKVNGNESITYTPNTTIDLIDSFKVTCTGTVPVTDENGKTTTQKGTVEYTVHIIPATNVYYEENFMTAGAGWTTTGTASTVNQTTDTLGNTDELTHDIYGFDSNMSFNDFEQDEDEEGNLNYKYDKDGNPILKSLTYSNGSAYHAQLTVADSTKSATTKPVSFTFTGTGFDLVSECNDKTGILIVTIAGKNNGVKKGYIVDTFFCGDYSNVIQKGTTVYQVPVVRELELAHDTYDVKVYGYITPKAGVVVGPVASASLAAYGVYNDSVLSTDSIIADALNACGITDISVDDVEVVYMDDNSILNGGSGVSDEAFISAVSSDAVATMSDTTADTSITADFYLDAFRVYNPLTDSSVYNPDKEDNVTYQSLFDSVWDSVEKKWLTDQNLVYVEYDGPVGAGKFTVESYKETGPQNELYLAPGCGIAFGISLSEGEFVHVSAKAVTGSPKLNAYDVSSGELYYNINSANGLKSTSENGVYVVTIQNTGSGILAVSGLKLRGDAAIKNSSETTQIALETMTRAMSSAEEYAPMTFNVSVPSTARKNRGFGIGISVSADKLDHLTVKVDDGTETTLTPYNAKAVELGDTAEYAYMHSVRIKTAGTHTITVTAYDANGNAATVTRSVEIK